MSKIRRGGARARPRGASLGLDSLRHRVDRLDAALVRLLNRRAGLSILIGQMKTRVAGTGREAPVYAPERERKILMRLTRGNVGPLTAESLRDIYAEIFAASRILQKRLRISYLGPEATFTHQAAIRTFGDGAEYVPARSIAEVFESVRKRLADYGVVPIENSTEGVVNHTLDLFVDSRLKICAETLLEISHHLLSHARHLRQVRRIYSHPQAIAQSRRWLTDHLPNADLVEVPSTAEAAVQARRSPSAAAIASSLAASRHQLPILASNIQDQADNFTRFYVIGRTVSQKPSGQDKTSIMFSVKDRVGALHAALVPFRRAGINLTRIESRPSKRRAWEYYFFADFDGHVALPRVRRVLRELGRRCAVLRVLGSYPRAASPR